MSKANAELVAKGEHYFQSEQCKRRVQRAVETGTYYSQSEEFKQAQSKRAVSLGKLQHTCPHCGKEGKGNAMFQHHFTNCRHKFATD